MRILLIFSFLATFKSHAQKPNVPAKTLFNLTICIEHISFIGNKKYRPRDTDYTSHSPRRAWAIYTGIDLPLTPQAGNHFQFYQSLRIGFLNNPGMQHSIRLYTEFLIAYKFSTNNSSLLQTGLQFGYMRAYPKGGMIRKTGNNITITHKGRGQLTGGLMAGVGYNFQNDSMEMLNAIQYHFWLQGPFIPGLAPLLPHESISLSSSVHH